MKRPVISERMFLYWTDREHPNTCRMTVRMQDAIEVTMMQEALRQTQTRYPYYSVRLGVTTDANGHEHYEYDDNPAPWVLNIGQEPVELFGAASHYHQLAFACWDDCVAIDFFHGLLRSRRYAAKIHKFFQLTIKFVEFLDFSGFNISERLTLLKPL
jgi:hypothetical protein